MRQQVVSGTPNCTGGNMSVTSFGEGRTGSARAKVTTHTIQEKKLKLEGGEKRVELVKRVLDAEIPVMGHIGLTPQSIHRMGGYKVQGKNLTDIEYLMKDAIALDRAGVFCMVLEGVPREVASMITN